MKIAVVGGGPAGLYFSALLRSVAPAHEVVVHERNRAADTFGFGVVFSDATMSTLRDADRESFDEIAAHLFHWDDIETHVKGARVRSTGHGFAGVSRKKLLEILQRRAASLGCKLLFEREVSDVDALAAEADLVLVADGANSGVRARFAEKFQPSIDLRPNRFVWLGTTFPFEAFTFYFKESAHGLFRVHAYRYAKEAEEQGGPISTFIVECTESTWRAAGLDRTSEDETVAAMEALFGKELAGHRLVKNRSLWRQFPTVKNAHWRHGKFVLLGDAAHTAHFSIGSGTKLAMEDAIALRDAIAGEKNLEKALLQYEEARRPTVERVQRAAEGSLRWFEETELFHRTLEPLPFTYSMLTRSLRIDHASMKARDPKLLAEVDARFAERAAAQSKVAVESTTPPMFTPFRLRGCLIANRVVVSPMCQYSAKHGLIDEWHLVHLGSRAVGGAGLVVAEMTNVEAAGRISPGCAGMYSPEHVVAWRRVVDFVHAHSPAKIGVQLAHAGRKASTSRPWEGGAYPPVDEPAWTVFGPSAIPFSPRSPTPKAMTEEDMDRILEAFVDATKMAEQAGFDLIELHGAHGYLLSSFLSPLSNARTDAYGGSAENRMRFPLQVFTAVRAVWPAEKPISVRISASDWHEGGITIDDVLLFARGLKERGCDVIDVSTGGTVYDAMPVYARLYQTPFAERVRLEVGIPVITVGAISSAGDVNAILAAERADLCALARGHLYDPYWTQHAAREQSFEFPLPAQYRMGKSFTPHR